MRALKLLAAVRRRRRPSRRLPLIVLFAVMSSPVAYAQKGSVTGVVRDSAGNPIPEADVSIVSAHLLSRTDIAGVFAFTRLGTGQTELAVRRLGYAPRSLQIDVRPDMRDTVIVVLVEQALELPGVAVNDQMKRQLIWIEDFYRRRAKGIGGTYFTRDDIEARHASRLSDVLRDAPGVRFVRSRLGSGVRFDASSNFRRDCQPQYWVDGQRVSNVEVDDFPVRDVEGIELYAGPSSTPQQFSQGAITTCGTVVIWSRVPGT